MSVTESTTKFAPAGTWSADPVHSNVSFEVAYAGVNTFRGSFSDFTATLDGGERSRARRRSRASTSRTSS